MTAYFKDVWIGISTVLVGMKVTFMHLFVPAITVQYPHETLEMNTRTRARLVNYEDECGVCLSCERVCPVNIFEIKGVRADKDEDLGMLPTGKPKRMHVVKFEIDFAKCVYCGLCVEACDTKSLRWEAPQEESTFTREEMYKSFVSMPQPEIDRLLKLEADRKAARAAAGPPRKGKPPVKAGVRPGKKTAPAPDKTKSQGDIVDTNQESNKREPGDKPAE